jgi:rhodanese-related sulfurtransferase
MTRLNKIICGAALMIVQAAAVGLAMNAVNPRPLPWVRVPLGQTHKVANSREVLGASPLPAVKDTRAASALPEQSQSPPATKVTPTVTSKPVDKPIAVPTAKAGPAQTAQPAKRPAPRTKKVEALFTTLPDAKALFDRKAAVFVDARHKEDYDLEHVPGALSIFVDDLGKLYDGALGAIPKDKILVTYCSDPQCETAIKLADALVARGHTRVFILLEGLPGWKGAGYPTDKGAGK